jgi:hypothetical protein
VRIRFARNFLVGRAERFAPENLSLAASFAAKAGIASMRIIPSTSVRAKFLHAWGDYRTGVPSESFSWIEIFVEFFLDAS